MADRDTVIRQELAAVDGAAPGEAGADACRTKHARMAASPFRFYRGACQLFYRDLKDGVVTLPEALRAPPLTRIQGDCHAANFGYLTEDGSHGDRVVWCPNDYDDAAMGPAAWDLLRFTASLHLAADVCRDHLGARAYATEEDRAAFDGLTAPDDSDSRAAAMAFLQAYAKTCKAVVKDPDSRDDALGKVPKGHALRPLYKKARARTCGGKKFGRKSSLAKLATVAPGKDGGETMAFDQASPKIKGVDAALAAEIRHAFRPYVDDAVLDVARRLGAGTGSIDVDRFYLLVGPEGVSAMTSAIMELHHVVEVKQQRPASLLRHFPDLSPVNRLDPAHLTVDCQRHMQRRPDLVLDEVVWREAHWLVRSRHHARVGADPELFLAKDPGRTMVEVAAACGRTLALAHARGDRRSTRFEAAMADALRDKTTTTALLDAAEGYAAQVTDDWRRLTAMVSAAE